MRGRNHNRLLGRLGEDAACRFLIKKGHSIIERNWKYRHLEIDIISLDKNGIHFVEVKSRQMPLEAEPQESVTYSKQLRIYKAALGYVNRKESIVKGNQECHFDIISVIFKEDTHSIKYFEDAFFPGI